MDSNLEKLAGIAEKQAGILEKVVTLVGDVDKLKQEMAESRDSIAALRRYWWVLPVSSGLLVAFVGKVVA